MIYRARHDAQRTLADSDAFTRTYSYFRTHHQHLSSFFYNAAAFAAGLVGLDDGTILALERLTLASQSLYIDAETFLTRAVERDELVVATDILNRLAQVSNASARVLLSRYYTLPYPLAVVAEHIVSLVDACSRSRAQAETALSFCLEFSDPERSRLLLQGFAVIASSSPATVEETVARFHAMGQTTSWESFAEWFGRGTSLITSNRVEEGVNFLRMRTRESRWLLGLGHIVLEDLKNVLKIYCTSLAARELQIVSLEMSSFGFPLPYTDGSSIFLPPEAHYSEDAQHNERMYTALAALQAASIPLGTYRFELAGIDFEDELHDRYGTLLPEILSNVRKHYAGIADTVRESTTGEIEVVFPGGRTLGALNTEHEKFYYSFPTPEFAREIFLIVENARIETQLGRKYAGLREDFSALDAYLASTRPIVPPPGNDKFGQFRTALECLIQFSLIGRWTCRLD